MILPIAQAKLINKQASVLHKIYYSIEMSQDSDLKQTSPLNAGLKSSLKSRDCLYISKYIRSFQNNAKRT